MVFSKAVVRSYTWTSCCTRADLTSEREQNFAALYFIYSTKQEFNVFLCYDCKPLRYSCSALLEGYIQGCGLQMYSWLVIWYKKSVSQKPQEDVFKCQRYSVCCHSQVKELENIHIKEARIREFWLYCSLSITQSELFIKNSWGLIWWLTTNWLIIRDTEI